MAWHETPEAVPFSEINLQTSEICMKLGGILVVYYLQCFATKQEDICIFEELFLWKYYFSFEMVTPAYTDSTYVLQ